MVYQKLLLKFLTYIFNINVYKVDENFPNICIRDIYVEREIYVDVK